MRGKYALHPKYFHREYEYPFTIDDVTTLTEIGDIIMFNEQTIGNETMNVQCEAGIIIQYNTMNISDGSYGKFVKVLPLLSYVILISLKFGKPDCSLLIIFLLDL